MPSVAQDPAQAPPLPRGAPGGPMASMGSLHHPLGPASKARPTQGQAAVPKHGRTPAAWPAPSPVCSQVEQWALALWTPRGGCCVALEPWPALSEPLVPTVDWTLVSIMDKAQGLPRSPSIQPGKVGVGGGSLNSCSTALPLLAPWPPGPLVFSSLGHPSASAGVGDPLPPALGSAGSNHWPCPAFPPPGAKWRQPPLGGLAGARQGLAPSPREEQEVPGRARLG